MYRFLCLQLKWSERKNQQMATSVRCTCVCVGFSLIYTRTLCMKRNYVFAHIRRYSTRTHLIPNVYHVGCAAINLSKTNKSNNSKTFVNLQCSRKAYKKKQNKCSGYRSASCVHFYVSSSFYTLVELERQIGKRICSLSLPSQYFFLCFFEFCACI